MKKFLAVVATVVLASVATSAIASEFGDLKVKMGAARESLVTMMMKKDKRGADQQKLVKESANAVSAQLSKMKAPAGKEAQFKELVDTWGAFKKTRETDLVPAILKGDDEKAQSIGGGIQKERITRCQALITELDN
ncbi:MAG: hypothetical protein WCI39_12335 [Gallionellaceae bacterium]